MADQRVNGNLILIGSNGGTIALGCQPSGGGFTILLPTSIPQVGQSLVIASVFNGNTATAQWSAPSGITSVAFSAPSIFSVSGTPITSIPAWSGVTSYQTGQSANYLGVTYTALSANSNQQPNISPSFWAVTSSGIITLGLTAQTPNTVWAGPNAGLASAPTFRPLAIADLPATGSPSSTTFLRGDGVWAVPADVDTFVSTFNGRTGTVVSQSGDYSYAQISGTPQLPITPVVPSHNWLNGYSSTTGVFSFSQPASTDLSDSSALARLASPTFTGTVTLPAVNVTGSLTYTTANPTFFSSTGSGAVVLATSPTISGATLAGTTTTTNVHIMGTLADGTNSVGTSGQVLTSTVTGVQWTTVAAGTVTSVAMTVPGFLSVSGSPITTSGTLAVSLQTQTANTVFAGPQSGGATTPTFRLLTATDIPALPYAPTASPTFTGTVTLPAVTLSGAMTVGTGASIGVTGSGTVEATQLWNVLVSSTPPTTGQVLTATSATSADWQTPSGGTLTGSIAANQIVIGTGTSSVTSTPNFTWASGVFSAISAGYTVADTSSAGLFLTESGTGPIVISGSSNTAPTVLQSGSFLQSSVSSYSFSYTSPVVANNQLVLFVGLDHTATHPTVITDNQGNTWTQREFFVGLGDTHGFTLYTTQAGTSGTETISLTFATTTNVAVLFAEVQNASEFDQIRHNTGTSASWSSSTLTTLIDHELLLAFDVAYRPPANLTDSFSELQSQTLPFSGNVQMDMASKNAATVGAYTSSWTQASSGEWHTIIMSYLPAATSTVTAVGKGINLTSSGTAGVLIQNVNPVASPGVTIQDIAGDGISIQSTFDGATNGVSISDAGTGVGALGIQLSAASQLTAANTGTGGTSVTDSGGGGITLTDSGTGGISLVSNQGISTSNTAGTGGTTIHDTSGIGITIQDGPTTGGGLTLESSVLISISNSGAGSTAISKSGAGGINIVNSGSPILLDTYATGAGTSALQFHTNTTGGLTIQHGAGAVTAGLNTTLSGGISTLTVIDGIVTAATAGGGGGGTIGGTIATNQIAFGTATNTIGGSANLTWTSGVFAATTSGASGFTVSDNSSGGGLTLSEAGSGGLNITNTGTGGLGITDTSTAGLNIAETGAGQIFLRSTLGSTGAGISLENDSVNGGISLLNTNHATSGGGTSIEDDSTLGITLTSNGGIFPTDNSTFGIGLTETGTGGIQLTANNASGNGIALSDTSATGIFLHNTGSGPINLNVASGTGAIAFNTNATGGLTINGTPGVTAGPFSTITSIQTENGVVITLTGTSDVRLKTNIQPFARGLDAVAAITPSTYQWNEAGQKRTGFSADVVHAGFIAQDVQKAIPEAIGQEGEYLSLDTRPILAALVNAVKELSEQNKALQKRIKKLENNS